MADTHGARDPDRQQIWDNAKTKLAELLLNIHTLIEKLPRALAGRPQAQVELEIDRLMGELDAMIPILAKFTDDVAAKNIVERWPKFKESWAALKAQRGKWNIPEFDLMVHATQLAGAVAMIRGYALALPPNPPK